MEKDMLSVDLQEEQENMEEDLELGHEQNGPHGPGHEVEEKMEEAQGLGHERKGQCGPDSPDDVDIALARLQEQLQQDSAIHDKDLDLKQEMDQDKQFGPDQNLDSDPHHTAPGPEPDHGPQEQKEAKGLFICFVLFFALFCFG